MTRDLELARQAYAMGDVNMSKQTHGAVPENLMTQKEGGENDPLKGAVHQEKHSQGGNYLRSFVYGGMDGLMTTFAVVASSIGANLGIHVILALGLANMIGDGLSMALGDFISTKSEQEFFVQEREREKWEVENNPEGEKKEMVRLYRDKGMDIEDAKVITGVLSKYKDAWIDVMMLEELELAVAEENPFKNAGVTFLAFQLFGLVPLIPYIVSAISGLTSQLFLVSCILTGTFLCVIGISKSFFSISPWWKCSGEMLLVGGCSAIASYFIGYAFENVSA